MLQVESMVLGVDSKRLHIAHRLLVDDRERATFECMLLHYDTRASSAIPFADDRLADLKAARIGPMPDWVGRAVRTLG